MNVFDIADLWDNLRTSAAHEFSKVAVEAQDALSNTNLLSQVQLAFFNFHHKVAVLMPRIFAARDM